MLAPTMDKVDPGSRVDSSEPNWAKNGMLAVAGIAAFSFVLHMIVNGRYGYFRDEFNYIICGNHPAWGYVDQPPMVPILSRIFRAVFGDSLRSIRLMPVLSTSALILLTGVITRELGGRRFAVVLSALTILIAPIYLSGGSLLTSQKNSAGKVLELAIGAGKDSNLYVVNRANQIEERDVKLGLETPDKYEVLSGLQDGDLVVIGNRSAFQAGEKVEPKLIQVAQRDDH